MDSFNELSLHPALKRAVDEMGFEKPSPIQAQTLPILLGAKTDFIGLAATGTGKTAAFSLPLLQTIDPKKKAVQALILCPTRELSQQVAGQVDLLGKHLGIRSLAVYGGSGYDEQLRGLKRGAPVVVGTPGRIIDHMERGTLVLDDVRTVVLDEADEMISMGFREAMETILREVNPELSNTWLFSATMSGPVRRVADEFLNDPQQVQVNRTEMLSAGVEQIYYMTQEKNKPEVLCKLIDAADDFYGVIFCQMKALVVDLTRYLNDRGYKVDSLHGDMSQSARESAMLAFRERRVKVLVCTDVAARGLDVKDITHVINFSLPRELDNYVHRIGRTARSGKTGLAMSLVTPSHRHLVVKIERMTKSKMREGVIPSRREIGLKKVGLLLQPFMAQENFERAGELMGEEWKTAVAAMTSEEVAARFLSMQFPYVFAEKKQAAMEGKERDARYAERRERGNRDDRGDRGGDRRDDRRGGDRPRMTVQKMNPEDRQFWSDTPPEYTERKGSRMIVDRNTRAEDADANLGAEADNTPDNLTAAETGMARQADFIAKGVATAKSNGTYKDNPRRGGKSGFKPLRERQETRQESSGGSYEPRGERKKPKHERELSANQLRKRERREERRADKKIAGKANKKFKAPFKKFGKSGGDQPPRRRSHY